MSYRGGRDERGGRGYDDRDRRDYPRGGGGRYDERDWRGGKGGGRDYPPPPGRAERDRRDDHAFRGGPPPPPAFGESGRGGAPMPSFNDRAGVAARMRRDMSRDMSMDALAMPPPSRGPGGFARDGTMKERSMTIEAPMLDPHAPQEVLLCQACAETPATLVCYNCAEMGAMYCEGCFGAVHSDPSMAGHTNKGPLLRCQRGDCSGKYATWWCSICADVCEDCVNAHCAHHRDQNTVLIKASTKNADLVKAMGGDKAMDSSSDSSSSSSSDSSSSSSSGSSSSGSSSSGSSSSSSSRRRRRKRRKRGQSEDEIVPTWGRGQNRKEIEAEDARLKQEKAEANAAPPGLKKNPKTGFELPDGSRVGLPRPLRAYTCDFCRHDVGHVRFRCTLCYEPDYDLCEKCFNSKKHKHDNFLMISGFSANLVVLPSAAKRVAQEAGEPEEAPRPVGSPCKKFWEGRCSDPCPWGRPHVRQDPKPDHCCFICGGTGHFAKECRHRDRLEKGDAEAVTIVDDARNDDGVSISAVLGFVARPPPTDEERLARSIMNLKQLNERVTSLQKFKRAKKLRKKGVEVEAVPGEDALLMGLDALGQPIANPNVRAKTPELEEIDDMTFAEQTGAKPPRQVDPIEVAELNVKDVYDAARERWKGAKKPDEVPETEWDQDYYDKFEALLAKVELPTHAQIDALVKEEIAANPTKFVEIMCLLEMRLQDAKLKPLPALAGWYIADAIFKRVGGAFLAAFEPNMDSVVESFLPRLQQIHPRWRTRCRDMLRSWREFYPKDTINKLLDVTK